MTSEAGHAGGTVTSDYLRISADHAQLNRSSFLG